jgi:protein-S-isoprenylcysteine O-methyltransferase Ste14
MLSREKHYRKIPRMHWGLLKIIIVLPGTALVFITALILLFARNSRFALRLVSFTQDLFWLALLVASIGLTLTVWTESIFIKFGRGTPAPWNPPKKLVVRGPYRYVRNPMITGALLILLSEVIFFHSWPIAVWMTLFFTANELYFRLVEEKGLEKRFGNEYLNYKTHVPRWIPRLKPWRPANHDSQKSSGSSFARSHEWIFRAEAPYELSGLTPNVVCPTDLLLHNYEL